MSQALRTYEHPYEVSDPAFQWQFTSRAGSFSADAASVSLCDKVGGSIW